MRHTQEEIDRTVARWAGEQRKDPTPAERVMRDLLKPLGFRFQVPMTGRTKNGGTYPYIIDLYHPGAKLCVEVDGRQHEKRTKGRDRRRTNRLAFAEGIAVLRFPNKRVLAMKKGVYVNHEAILFEVKEAMYESRTEMA